MNKIYFNTTKIVVALLGLVGAAVTWAKAPTHNLTVKGDIKAPACTVNIVGGQGGGTLQYGKISPSIIRPGTDLVALEPRVLDWLITCDANTYLTYTVLDNEAASTNTRTDKNISFGLGFINGTGKLGYYTMRPMNLKVDGQNAYFGVAITGTADSLDTYSKYVENVPGHRHGWGVRANADYSELKAGKEFAMQMEVTPYLSGESDMKGRVTDHVPLTGSTTFTFAFGL